MKLAELNLSALKYFIDAVELDSISLSASKNHVSRPAVSQAILRLGHSYGKPLLLHEKRVFSLSDAGKDFYQKAKQIVANIEAQLSTKDTQAKSQTLKIGCSPSLIDIVFPKIDAHLRKAEAPIIQLGTTVQLLDHLNQGSIHLAFAVDSGQKSHFKSTAFRSGAFVALSPSVRFDKTLITTEERPETESFLRFVQKKRIVFQTHIQVESWTVAARLAQLNQGCCIVPDFVERSGLKAIKTPGWAAPYQVRVWSRKPYELSGLEQRILDQAMMYKS